MSIGEIAAVLEIGRLETVDGHSVATEDWKNLQTALEDLRGQMDREGGFLSQKLVDVAVRRGGRRLDSAQDYVYFRLDQEAGLVEGGKLSERSVSAGGTSGLSGLKGFGIEMGMIEVESYDPELR